MSKYCRLIAIEYGLSEKESDLIELAAPMHDVGKIGIDDNILKKPGKLDKDEWAKMQQHAAIGSEILGEHNDDLLSAAAIMALQHHEKWNGKGYPNGLKKDAIHLYARIVAVADVFDDLTSKRPYKEPWPIEKALNLIKEERGEHFNPIVVDAFMEVTEDVIKICKEHSG